MTFEEWWEENKRNYSSDPEGIMYIAQDAWNAAYQEGHDDEVYDSYEG